MRTTSSPLARTALALCLCAGLNLAVTSPSFANAGTKTEGKAKAEKDTKGNKAPAPKKKKPATEAKEGDGKGVGYSDTEIQLSGMMVPYHTREGLNYQVMTVRLQLAPGEMERPACFMAPIVGEKFLMYLHAANLGPDDFAGQKRDLLAKNLLDIAIKTTDRSFYSGVVFVDETTPPLENKSQTLSSQCK